jgi:uncharacterized short protein YbdD (DUF466 family)
MRRKFTFQPCRRRDLPALLRAQIMLRQNGRCFDCGTRLMLGRIVFDHRPPLALRGQDDDANNPERLAAICTPCHQRKTPRDLKDIAKAKRLASDHQDFVERMRDKIPGRPVPSKGQWQKMKKKMKAAEPTVGRDGRSEEGRQMQGSVSRPRERNPPR